MSNKIDIDLQIECYPGINKNKKNEISSYCRYYRAIFQEKPEELFLNEDAAFFFSSQHIVSFEKEKKKDKITILPISKQILKVVINNYCQKDISFDVTLHSSKASGSNKKNNNLSFHSSSEHHEKLRGILEKFIIPNLFGG